MANDLYVEVANFTVAKTFTKDDKSKLVKAMSDAARDALAKTKLTVSKKTPKTMNFTLGGALHRRFGHAGLLFVVTQSLLALTTLGLLGFVDHGALFDAELGRLQQSLLRGDGAAVCSPSSGATCGRSPWSPRSPRC